MGVHKCMWQWLSSHHFPSLPQILFPPPVVLAIPQKDQASPLLRFFSQAVPSALFSLGFKSPVNAQLG